jgi:hypothetical protein
MAQYIIITIEVIEPYTDELLDTFGIEPGSADEYAFCLGWQDGVSDHAPSRPPVTTERVIHYQSGWALGSINRMVWTVQSAKKVAETNAPSI